MMNVNESGRKSQHSIGVRKYTGLSKLGFFKGT